MTQETFNQIVEHRIRTIRMVLAAKAKEYARGDRLHNFKRSAAFMMASPEMACFSFAMKHFTSVADMVDDVEAGAQPTPELAKEKIGDAINYLILLEALMEERAAGVPFGVAVEDSKGTTVKVRVGAPRPTTRRSK